MKIAAVTFVTPMLLKLSLLYINNRTVIIANVKQELNLYSVAKKSKLMTEVIG